MSKAHIKKAVKRYIQEMTADLVKGWLYPPEDIDAQEVPFYELRFLSCR